MKRIVFGVLIASALVSSCAKNGETVSSEGMKAMSLVSVNIGDGVRSSISGTAFSSADETGIGLFLTAMDGGNYDGRTSGYSNVKYVSAAGASTWTAVSPIMLSGTKGKLYGYYPYDSAVSDIKAVPVESSLDGTDYMYADAVENVSSKAPGVSLTLRHALARVTVKFVKDETYSGACRITTLSISGAGITGSGILDATAGTIFPASVSEVAFPVDTTFSVADYEAELLIVPALTEEGRQTVNVKCTMDSKGFDITLADADGVIVRQGVCSSVVLIAKNDGFTVKSVTVTDWDGGSGSNANTGHTVIVSEMGSGEYGGDINM